MNIPCHFWPISCNLGCLVDILLIIYTNFKYLQPKSKGGQAGLICTSFAPLWYNNSVVSLSCDPLTIESTKKLRLFSNFYLPIEINERLYQEYQKSQVSYSLEEAKKIGEEELMKKLDEQIEKKDSILDKKIIENHTEEYVEVEVG